jgi:hypothetical protein
MNKGKTYLKQTLEISRNGFDKIPQPSSKSNSKAWLPC